MVNNMGEPKYTPLEHAEWHGWTFTDLIFPFFLFIVGVAIPFSFARRSTTTQPTKGQMLARVWLRALSLFMLGELMFAWPMPMTRALPDGFMGYKALRIACFVFVYASLIALLVPWRWKRVQYLLPPIVAVVFYVLLVVVHYTQKHAAAAGWDATFGGGIFNPTNLRIPGVLQRIGIVYGVAGTIALFLGWRTIIAAIVVLCALYAALMLKVPFGPQHKAGSLTFEDNLARHVDEAVFDRYTIGADGKRVYTQRHTYNHYPDNEGLLSTIPAIATSLLGILVGLWLRTGRSPVERAAGLLAMGLPVLILGCLLNWWLMPINKILWTPSYVFYTGGLAMLCLGFLFWLVDVLGWRRWAVPFVIFGMNAIAAYVAASIVPKMLNLIQVRGAEGKDVGVYTWLKHYYTSGIQQASDWVANLSPHMPVIATPMNMTLLNSLCLVLLIWLLMALLYVCRVFVKV
jgi:predicted acyltransferase